jgi:hypothetical protein
MENIFIEQPQSETFALNRDIKLYLAETARWGNLLAIIGYVFMGLMVLISLAMIIAFSFIPQETAFPMWILGIVYLLMAGIYWIPVTYLYRFSAQMKLALKNNVEQQYTSGFANLKSLFKFFGVFTVAMLVLYGVVLIVAIPLSIFLK